MLNALAAVQGGLQARESALQGQASEQYRNALSQYGMEAPQTRQAFAAVDPRGANSLMMQERQMTQQGQQFEQTMGLREREFEAANADRQARLQITRQNAARQAMALTARMSAEERAREAEVLERALATATTARTPEDWDRIMTGFGEQGAQFVGQFERRDEIFAGVMGLTDALKAQSGPEFRQAAPEEAAQYGAAAGQFGPDGRFYPINPPSGMAIESDGQGGFRMAQGPGVQARPFTEGQSRDNVYVTRARGALEALDRVGPDVLTSFGQRAANMDPTGVVRGAVQTDQFQVAQQAMSEFLQAILRKDTGAAITAQEQDLYGVTYGPQPGDSPAVLAEKARARQRAINAIEAGMSPAQMLAVERGLQAGQEQPPAASPGRGGNRTPAAAPQGIPAAPSWYDPGPNNVPWEEAWEFLPEATRQQMLGGQ